jgi:hypothetical protein
MGTTGLSIWFPLSNTSSTYDRLVNAYVNYTAIIDWVRFVFQYVYTPHVTFYFANPTISLTPGNGYVIEANTTLDTVVKTQVLFGIFMLNNVVMVSGSREVYVNFTTNNVQGSWDGNFYRIDGTTNFYPFVQQIRSMNFVSLVAITPSGTNQLIKGVFSNGALSIQDWYVQDGPNVGRYTLTSGTTVTPASTKPFVLATNNFDMNEVQTSGVSFTATGNSISLEKVPFGMITMYPKAYVFLMTRNIQDQFGFVGWSISTTDQFAWNTPLQLPPPARFANYPTANMTVNFKQRVKTTSTHLLISFRNGGSQDISSATATVVGFPPFANLTTFNTYPRGACMPANSNDGPDTMVGYDAIMCQIGRIAARSFVKVKITVYTQIFFPPQHHQRHWTQCWQCPNHEHVYHPQEQKLVWSLNRSTLLTTSPHRYHELINSRSRS